MGPAGTRLSVGDLQLGLEKAGRPSTCPGTAVLIGMPK
jgi:hypothetical protein